MKNGSLLKINTISTFHRLRGLPAPKHPLISVINYVEMEYSPEERNGLILGFYTISVKKNVHNKLMYGHQEYDFDEGIMYFTAPNQTIKIEVDKKEKPTGWLLLIHPDFLWNTPLAKNIHQFGFFDYAVNEALFLSESEEMTLLSFIKNIEQEYNANIDTFSKQILITQIESLLRYSERYYNRQFITRDKKNHTVLEKVEEFLHNYFEGDDLVSKGLPTVQMLATSVNLSPKYLGNLLKTLTGLSAQQHIHEKLISKAKERLGSTEMNISEIAYELGFGHVQSFSKFFKQKTNLTPLDFRASFN